MPKNWTPHSVQREIGGGDLFRADEPAVEGRDGRTLNIARMRTTGWVAPMEHLFLSHMLSEQDLAPGVGRGDPPRVESLDVGGWPGVLVTRTLEADARWGSIHKKLFACAVLPSSQALVIELRGPGSPDAADEELVRQMAETLAVTDIPAPPEPGGGGGAVELPDGIELAVPPHFIALPCDDPNRTSRDLLLASSDGWVSVELIPCIFFPEDGPETLETMLAAHDRGWKDAVAREAGARQWQADKPDSKAFPARAYLLANGDDEALLAIFHGGYHDSSRFDAAWQALAPTVRFAGRTDLGEMLRTGTDQAQRLAATGLDKLLPASGHQQWSLWDQRENVDQVLWMRLWWQWISDEQAQASGPAPVPAAAGNGERLVCPIDPYATDGGRTAFERTWQSNPDWSIAQTAQWEFQVDDRGNAIGQLKAIISRVALEDGQLHSKWPQTNATPRFAPNQYVPGCWLPLLLGKLADKPMILRTESFVGCDGAPLPGLLTLTITRPKDGPTKPDEKGEPMDCVSVRVNGTGTLSRWYYAKDGTLRYIDMANGLRARQGANQEAGGDDAARK
jgi:hypothetical protein